MEILSIWTVGISNEEDANIKNICAIKDSVNLTTVVQKSCKKLTEALEVEKVSMEDLDELDTENNIYLMKCSVETKYEGSYTEHFFLQKLNLF